MTSPSCPTCGGTMQAYIDKRGKPYAQCAPCGAQFFVRTKQGAERFTAKFGTPSAKGSATPPATKTPAAAPARSEPAKTPEGASGGKDKKFDLLDW